MVPRLTRPNDIVRLIFGAQVPCVLRPVPEQPHKGSQTRYRLVGECYVYGMMDGEGLKLGHEPRSFEII